MCVGTCVMPSFTPPTYFFDVPQWDLRSILVCQRRNWPLITFQWKP